MTDSGVQDSGTGADCGTISDTCDLDCNGRPDLHVVVVEQPSGAVLPFADLPAALAVASDGATVVVCPGDYRGNVVVTSDIELVAWDSGVFNRPVLRPASDGPVVTLVGGRTATLFGLRIAGCALRDTGGSGAGGSGHGCYPELRSTGVRIAEGGVATLDHLVVVGHTDGGIRAEAASSEISHSTIRSNSVDGNGGGLALEGCTSATLDAVTIAQNNAFGDGGGIHLDSCEVTSGVGGVVVSDNSADRGGGVFADASSLSGEPWAVLRNDATQSGGGVYLRSSSVDASLALVQQNEAKEGGGAYVADGGGLGPGVVSGNTAISGGGVLVDALPESWVEISADILDNSAQEGGGLYLAGGNVTAPFNRVAGNQSLDARGGGALISSGASLQVELGDWGAPLTDDNDPPDAYPVDLESHHKFETDVCFVCTSADCFACE